MRLVLVSLGFLLPCTVFADTAPAAGAPAAAGRSIEIHGSFGAFVDGRWAQNSSSVRQDWNATGDADIRLEPVGEKDWALVATGRVVGDLDGRRPSEEPGIYNGIQETYRGDVQPWLYRAYGEWRPRRDFGVIEAPEVRLGRQYHTGGEALWFDGGEVRGRVTTMAPVDLEVAIFGGVPVRLFEGEGGNWIAGAGLALPVGRGRAEAEAYYVEEEARFGFIRKDLVGRLSASTPVGENAFWSGTLRAIDDGEADLFTQARWNPKGGRIQLRGDFRAQFEDRGPHATEVDAASIILGRSVGAPRRDFKEAGLAVSIPYRTHLLFDLGGSTRMSGNPQDRNNFDFDRLFATAVLSDIRLAGRSADASATFEAYESAGDWTRTATGDLALHLRENLTASLGTTYALYSYDYATQMVKDDVRIGTARLEWRPKPNLRFEGRYDLEDDDQRAHHFVRTGVTYGF